MFDYKSPTCADDIAEYTSHELVYALDCISERASMELCYEALGRKGGKYIALNPFPLETHTRRSVQPDLILVFSQFN